MSALLARSTHMLLVKTRHESYKDKDSFIGMQEFVVGYSKAP